MEGYIKNLVQKVRIEASMTQEELAQKTQVSRQTIVAVERGNYTPSVLLALKIAKVFKMPVENLFMIRYEK
jgi:putative transcriptional regulator